MTRWVTTSERACHPALLGQGIDLSDFRLDRVEAETKLLDSRPELVGRSHSPHVTLDAEVLRHDGLEAKLIPPERKIVDMAANAFYRRAGSQERPDPYWVYLTGELSSEYDFFAVVSFPVAAPRETNP